MVQLSPAGKAAGSRRHDEAGSTGLFPEPPPPPERPQPQETAAVGPHGGPSVSYRGARIECLKGGHVCTLYWEEHPLHGRTFGVPGAITPLIDLWAEEGRLPPYMRAVPKGN